MSIHPKKIGDREDHQWFFYTQMIWFHQFMFVLWQHLHLIFSFTMSKIVLRVSISCKDIFDSNKRKSLIKNLLSSNDICNEDNICHLPI
jgi:hypothetical protein